jgi:hypothetical protein
VLQTKDFARIMTVMAPREKWTDERLDALDQKVDDGFDRLETKFDVGLARVDTDVREVRGDIKDLKTEINTRFDSQNRATWAGFIAVVAAIVGSKAF